MNAFWASRINGTDHSTAQRTPSKAKWIELKDVAASDISTAALTDEQLEIIQQADTLPQLFRKYIQFLTSSKAFDGFIIAAIVCNSLLIAIETDIKLVQRNRKLFQALDLSFLMIYTLEFLLKIVAEPIRYWKSAYNVFDFSLLVLSILELGLSVANKRVALHVIRAFRAVRILRSISFVPSLRVLVNALFKTFRSTLNLVLLDLLLIFVFGIIGFYVYGASVPQYWGTLGQSMLSLFVYTTADGWTEIENAMEARDVPVPRVYTLVFMAVGYFIFTNLFIGVIIQNLEEATREDKEIKRQIRSRIIAKKKQFILDRQKQDFANLMARQQQFPNLNIDEILSKLVGQLRHDDLVPMSHLSCNLRWMEMYIATLYHQENTMYRIQQLHFETARTIAEIVERRLQNKVAV